MLAQHIFDVDQRRVERDAVRLPTRMRLRSPPHGPAHDAVLINLSRYGFLAETALNAIDGDLVAIELPTIGEVKARKVWSMDREIGAEFLIPLACYPYYDMMALLNAEKAGPPHLPRARHEVWPPLPDLAEPVEALSYICSKKKETLRQAQGSRRREEIQPDLSNSTPASRSNR